MNFDDQLDMLVDQLEEAIEKRFNCKSNTLVVLNLYNICIYFLTVEKKHGRLADEDPELAAQLGWLRHQEEICKYFNYTYTLKSSNISYISRP